MEAGAGEREAWSSSGDGGGGCGDLGAFFVVSSNF